ncbi:MAG: DNA alkylation repair protein, partial [Methanomassiliicoccales archaeon]|nr:DNA alkylation repair protein [Methanomassiliicoccales archaeon]
MEKLIAHARPENVEGMRRYGISGEKMLGVPMPVIRAIAKELGKDQKQAEDLWATGVHEARILASLLAVPKETTRSLMDSWVEDFDSWDVCDQVCANLFCRTASAYDVVPAWTSREEQYVRRAGFVMIATLAVHDKRSRDEALLRLHPAADPQTVRDLVTGYRRYFLEVDPTPSV